MHLARKSDGGDRVRRESRRLKRFANSQRGGAPPVSRVLFRPARLRTGEIGMRLRAGGQDCSPVIEDDRARSAGADVNTENENTASFYRRTFMPETSPPLRAAPSR